MIKVNDKKVSKESLVCRLLDHTHDLECGNTITKEIDRKTKIYDLWSGKVRQDKIWWGSFKECLRCNEYTLIPNSITVRNGEIEVLKMPKIDREEFIK